MLTPPNTNTITYMLKHEIMLTHGEGTDLFVAGKPAKVEVGGGFVIVTGTVKFADGSLHNCLLEICEQDSGEHYGTGVWTVGGKVTWQDDNDFLASLGKTSEQVYPYKYCYWERIPGDHHVGADGWSRC